MALSPHFSMNETIRSATAASKGIDNQVPLVYRYNIGRTAQLMEDIRALLGSHPLKVTSWYRSDTLNKAIGGSETSAHPKGLAVDWKPTVDGMNILDAFHTVAKSALPFDQLIMEGTKDGAQWIHVGLSVKNPRRQVMEAHGDKLGGPMAFRAVNVRELEA